MDYLGALPNQGDAELRRRGIIICVNNYNPGYFGDGSNAYTDTNPNNYVFTIPPSNVHTIGDLLNTHNISWAYYGDQFARYLNDNYDVRARTTNIATSATGRSTRPTS